MFRTVLILLFLMAFGVICAPNLVRAQDNPAYMVHNVKVDILAESAVKARDQAFSAAETQAFKMLAERFLPPDQLTTFIPPDVATIAGMVADFEITSEQLSTRRYLGTYVFRFKAGPVNRYFGHGPVNYSDMASDNKLLVLPVFVQNGQNALWDLTKNPWLQAWQNGNDATSNLLIPKADVSDKMDIRETDPAKFSQSGFKRIRSRYDANDIVILAAVFDQTAHDILTINIYRTDRGQAEFVQAVAVPQGQATKLGELLGSAVIQAKGILAGNWKNQADYQVTENDTNPAVIDETLAGQTPVQPEAPKAYAPQAGQIRVMARFVNMGEWLSVRRSLNGIPPLQSIQISSLSTNQASMEFSYTDWMALTSALSARGLSLQSAAPGQYNLIRTNPIGYNR